MCGGGGDAYDDVQTVATTKAQARKWILEHDTKVAVLPQFAAAAAVHRRRSSPPPQLGHTYTQWP